MKVRWAVLLTLSIALPLPRTTLRAENVADDGVPTALEEYVARPEPDAKWTLREKPEKGKRGVYSIELVSQTWQGIRWVHSLTVYEPAEIEFPHKMILYNTGGKVGDNPGVADQVLGLRLAQVAGCRVAFLMQIPNQPLLGDRVEDDLITETFLRYLKTRDQNWPLLFPMVKSVVKAMDALEEVAKKEWEVELDGFLITGASKRGWTSWLSAVADKRVFAIAPIVIDMLNVGPQMKYQFETWGEYSEQIKDYTSKGLVQIMQKNPEIPLWRWMDPYTYRKRLTLPKLLINGTNDPYWVVDALNNYWDDLLGPKYILYVPNAGHGLEGGRDLALSSLAGFFRHTASGRPMPALRWKHTDGSNGPRLEVAASPAPIEALLWTATSPTKDFRKAKWESRPMTPDGEGFVGEVDKPSAGHVALFGELRFNGGGPGRSFSLSTQLRRD